MRLISILMFTLLLLKVSFQYKENKKSYNLGMMKSTYGFSKLKQFYNEQVLINRRKEKLRKELERTLRKQKEEEKEENRRKILNEHLMPLTRGNSFMRDFYAGRY